jgi:tRNA(fMet)-specific endonuclease VapC
LTYSLDTNAVIALGRQPRGPVAQRLRRHSVNDLAISSIVVHELYFGALRSAQVSRNLAQLDALAFPVLDLTREDVVRAAEIRAILFARGAPVGGYDILIAGQALARGLTVVTANTREFARVEGLQVEDWSA